MVAPNFTIKHIGINNKNVTDAEALLNYTIDLFGLKRGGEDERHVFAGSIFEIMKNQEYGSNGHIALQTADVEYAIAYFAEKGVGIKESTVRRNEEGKVVFAYLDLELGGFALHLTL